MGTTKVGPDQIRVNEPDATDQTAAHEPPRNPIYTWQLNGPSKLITGEEWNNVYNPTTKYITSITVTGGIATATCAAHGFSNGTSVIIGGFPTYRFGLYFNGAIGGVTTNTFTYTPYSIPDGTYVDAGIFALDSANMSEIKAQVFAKTYGPSSAQDMSCLLAQSTGALPAVNVYHNVERRPVGFNDYALTPSGSAMELGSSGPGSTGYFQSGHSAYGNGQIGGPVFYFDTWSPWTISNSRLTSVAYVNTTNIATVILNAAGFAPNPYETVTVGSVFTISGATVDTNLNGAYEVLTKTDRLHFTAQKVPIPGFSKAATATYTDAGLSLALETQQYGANGAPSMSPWANGGIFVQIRNPTSQGFIVEPMHLPVASVFPYLSTADNYLAYAVGQLNFNGAALARRFAVTLKGTVSGWRGQIPDGSNNALQPLSGVMQPPDATIVTVANTAGGSTLKTLTQFEQYFLTVGRSLRIKAWGIYTNLGGGSDILSIELISNTDSQAYMTVTSPVGATSDEGWSVEFNMIVLTAGAAGTMNMNAVGAFSNKGMQSKAGITNPTPVNTTVRQQWQVAALWGAASPSNSVTIQGLTVEVLN